MASGLDVLIGPVLTNADRIGVLEIEGHMADPGRTARVPGRYLDRFLAQRLFVPVRVSGACTVPFWPLAHVVSSE